MRIRLRTLRSALVLTLAVGVALAAVLGSSQAATRSGAELTVRSTHYGKAVFGPSGKVLYVFGGDKGGSTSRCYGVCAAAWPPLLTRGKPVAGPGVKATLLGTTRRRDGKLQVTYNGHPLYYYSADTPMKIKCQHVNMHGGLWLLIKPNGELNMAMGKMHM